MKQYLRKRKNVTDWQDSMNSGTFTTYLSDFLFHEDGARAKRNFKFKGDVDLICNEPAPPIRVTIIRLI